MPKIKHLFDTKNKEAIPVVAFDRPSQDWGLLSNYADAPIEMKLKFGDKKRTVIFPTVEHYFQFMKDPTNETYLKAILKGDAQHARDIGGKHFASVTKNNKDVGMKLENAWYAGGADKAMEDALRAKRDQHPMVEYLLKATGKACIVEDTGTRSEGNQDGNWGWKKGGEIDTYKVADEIPKPGNKLGRLWMMLRGEMNNEKKSRERADEFSDAAQKIMARQHEEENLTTLASPDGIKDIETSPSQKLLLALQAKPNPYPPTSIQFIPGKNNTVRLQISFNEKGGAASFYDYSKRNISHLSEKIGYNDDYSSLSFPLDDKDALWKEAVAKIPELKPAAELLAEHEAKLREDIAMLIFKLKKEISSRKNSTFTFLFKDQIATKKAKQQALENIANTKGLATMMQRASASLDKKEQRDLILKHTHSKRTVDIFKRVIDLDEVKKSKVRPQK